MTSEKPKEGPLLQFIVICIALMGIYIFGGRFIGENRLNLSDQMTVGTVIEKQRSRRSNTVHYEYSCNAKKCLASHQAVSLHYYRRLKIGSEVNVTYIKRTSENLTRIEKRTSVYIYTLIMTIFMFGLLVYYGRMMRRDGGI